MCTTLDDFLEDKAIWVVVLKSGDSVYQDDNRPNLKEPIAWKRLGSYILESGDSIVRMYLKFRSNIVELPSHAKGYLFCNAISKTFGDTSSKSHMVCGAISGSNLTRYWYAVPELIIVDERVEPVAQCRAPFLIKNPD